MSEWGRRNYGDPCRGCGYDWSLTREEALVPERGRLSPDDVCRTNTHDVAHHRWHIERSLVPVR